MDHPGAPRASVPDPAIPLVPAISLVPAVPAGPAISVTDWRLDGRGRDFVVRAEDLASLYDSPLTAGETLVFGWNDDADPNVIVLLGDTFCTVSLMLDGNAYALRRADGGGSDDAWEVLPIGDQEGSWRTSEILDRRTGLDVLRALPDLDRVRREHRWLSQWRHHADDDAPDIDPAESPAGPELSTPEPPLATPVTDPGSLTPDRSADS